MSPPQDETEAAARLASERALAFLAELDERAVLADGAAEAAARFGGPLPEKGSGALAAIEELAAATDAATASPGPRFFHFVTGGVTPAALGADWLATALDQNAFSWVGSPLGTRLETVALDWLKDLFGLPAEWGGALTTGATGANLAGLAAARQWWGEQHGRDIGAEGLAGLPPVPVLSSGFVHPSAVKALAILGLGREPVLKFSRDAVGRIDLPGLATALRELDGAPAILIGNAGEVNAGEFDPIAELADLAEEHGAWLHVDGAFGLFARVSPRVAALADGVERAHSVIADGHKWLNVPYDCGFAFVRDPGLLAKVFTLSAAYLPSDEPEPTYGYLVAESSQRARSLAVWAALRAWGRAGYRELVERNLDLAQRLARRGRRGSRPRAPRRRPAEHRLLPLPPCRHPRGGAERAERPSRRGRPRGRPGLGGDDELRRPRGVPAGDRELAHGRGGRRPPRRGRPRARRAPDRHKVRLFSHIHRVSPVTRAGVGLIG